MNGSKIFVCTQHPEMFREFDVIAIRPFQAVPCYRARTIFINPGVMASDEAFRFAEWLPVLLMRAMPFAGVSFRDSDEDLVHLFGRDVPKLGVENDQHRHTVTDNDLNETQA